MRALSSGFSSEFGHFIKRKQFYVANFINESSVFKVKAWDVLSCCPERGKYPQNTEPYYAYLPEHKPHS